MKGSTKQDVIVIPADDTQGLSGIAKSIVRQMNDVENTFVEVGKLLIEAKELIEDRTWTKWLEKNVDMSAITARRFIRVARAAKNQSPVIAYGYSKALILLTLPEDKREPFINEIHNVDGEMKTVKEMTKRELQKAVTAFKKSLSGQDDAEDKKDASAEPEEQQDPREAFDKMFVELKETAEELIAFIAKQHLENDDVEEYRDTLSSFYAIEIRKVTPEHIDAA